MQGKVVEQTAQSTGAVEKFGGADSDARVMLYVQSKVHSVALKVGKGVEALARMSNTIDKFSMSKATAPWDAAQERALSSLMQTGVSYPEHDVPRAMAATIAHVVTDIVHPGAKDLMGMHEYKCTASMDSLVAECITLVEVTSKYNLVLTRAAETFDQFVMDASKDIRTAVTEEKAQKWEAEKTAAFTRALSAHNTAQLGSSNVVRGSARGGAQGSFASRPPEHEVPCTHFTRGTCRMGAACGFKHEGVQPFSQAPR